MKGKKLLCAAPLFILPLLAGCSGDLGETLGKAGMNTLMGMGVVFVMLILISLVISAFSLINRVQDRKSRKAAPVSVKEEPAKEEEVLPEDTGADDTELVAVIAAAIAAYEGTSPDGVVIRSIRNVRRATNWRKG